VLLVLLQRGHASTRTRGRHNQELRAWISADRTALTATPGSFVVYARISHERRFIPDEVCHPSPVYDGQQRKACSRFSRPFRTCLVGPQPCLGLRGVGVDVAIRIAVGSFYCVSTSSAAPGCFPGLGPSWHCCCSGLSLICGRITVCRVGSLCATSVAPDISRALDRPLLPLEPF
jgi:hypothetical protein